MNLFCNRILLLSVITVFTLCTMDHAIAMESDKPAERRQGNLSGVTAGGNIAQAFNEHKGGEGGRAEIHNHIGSAPLLEREKKPDEYFTQGENYLKKNPPSWGEAMEAFRYAADVDPPHLFACLRCAEYFHTEQTSPDVRKSSHYYKRALLARDSNSELVYGGLMKLYYDVGVHATNERMKRDYLKKAMEYRKELTTLNDEEYSMLDDLEIKLSQLGIGGGISSNAYPSERVPVIATAVSLSEAEEKQAPGLAAGSKTITGVPEIARGYEAIYERFMGGSLIYRPTEGSDVGQIVMPFSDFVNPNTLEGTFDLSRCGDIEKYISIATGYRKKKTISSGLQIWFVPKFLVEREITTTAGHFRDILDKWNSPFGIFWTIGCCLDANEYDYNIEIEPENVTHKTFQSLGRDRHNGKRQWLPIRFTYTLATTLIGMRPFSDDIEESQRHFMFIFP